MGQYWSVDHEDDNINYGEDRLDLDFLLSDCSPSPRPLVLAYPALA